MTQPSRGLIACIALSVLMSVTASWAGNPLISASVYQRGSDDPIPWDDPNTPWEFPELMAGTDLTIVLKSSEGGRWLGGIYIADPFLERGRLFGRGYDPGTRLFKGSVLPAAGTQSRVIDRSILVLGDMALGFRLQGGRDAVPGEWYVVDCNTYAPGELFVDIMDNGFDLYEPLFSLRIPLVRSRDLDADGGVNLVDFAVLAASWGNAVSPDANTPPNLDEDPLIGPRDLAAFSAFWLSRTRVLPVPDPNAPAR